MRAIVSQRLLARESGQGRVAAVEILLNSPLITDLIFKGEVAEVWQHLPCGQLYLMRRDTTTMAVLGVRSFRKGDAA